MLKSDAEVSRTQRYRRHRLRRLGIEPTDGRGRHGHHANASQHYRWSPRIISSRGYVKLRVGVSHPLADPNGYAYEHQVVLAAAGIRLSAGQVPHHLNGDKIDNRLENLEVMSRGSHNTCHNQDRPRDRYGRLTARELPPPLHDPVTGRYLPRPTSGGRLLDGRTWDETPQEVRS